jgi:hypothetical protein
VSYPPQQPPPPQGPYQPGQPIPHDQAAQYVQQPPTYYVPQQPLYRPPAPPRGFVPIPALPPTVPPAPKWQRWLIIGGALVGATVIAVLCAIG